MEDKRAQDGYLHPPKGFFAARQSNFNLFPIDLPSLAKTW